MQQMISTHPKVKIPEDIICPITHLIMTDPVLLIGTDHTYEREAILKWFETKDINPLTGIKIQSKEIEPNHRAKQMILRFLEEHPVIQSELFEEIYLPDALIGDVVNAIEGNDSKALEELLEKNRCLLRKGLKNNKSLLTLGCELGSVEILKVILEKLGETLLSLDCVSQDKGLSLFLLASRRLGMEAGQLLSKALQWKSKEIETLFYESLKNDDVELLKMTLFLRGLNLNQTDGLEDIGLNCATEVGAEKCVKFLIREGFLIKEKDQVNEKQLAHQEIRENQQVELEKLDTEVGSVVQWLSSSLSMLFWNNNTSGHSSTSSSAKFRSISTQQQDLDALFKWTIEGHLLEVEKLLSKTPSLAFMEGVVTDLSGREFKNITVLHYAFWSLDIEMMEVILRCMNDKEEALRQITAFEKNPQNYSGYGVHYDVSDLVTKTKAYTDNYNKWDVKKREYHWQQVVGRVQRMCPAWVAYGMCEEGKGAAWCKKDGEGVGKKREYDKKSISWWFDAEYNGGLLGFKFGVTRGWGAAVESRTGGGRQSAAGYLTDPASYYGLHDHDVHIIANKNRMEAVENLKTQLAESQASTKFDFKQ